jgi:type IV pilus assembly protein PilA
MQPYAPSPFAPPPPPAPKGIPAWLIVLFAALGGVFVILPLFSVLAIYGVRKYIVNAKTAEARNALGQIAKDAAAAYEGGRAATLATPAAHALCASASRSVPENVEYVRRAKYQSAPGDWSVDAARNAGFACLRFSMDQPQYYMYSYRASSLSSGRSSPGDSFEARANGDLNGDGVLSTFTLKGHIDPNGSIAVDPNLLETDPQE